MISSAKAKAEGSEGFSTGGGETRSSSLEGMSGSGLKVTARFAVAVGGFEAAKGES